MHKPELSEFTYNLTMEITTSIRGGQKLCFEYTKKETNKKTLRWECSQRRSGSCKGAVVTGHRM